MRDVLRDFPSYTWICKLSGGRYFSGSLGTDGVLGTFEVYTFEYKIWRKTVETEIEEGEKEKKEFICVSCRVVPPVNSGEEIFGIEETEFDLIPENAEQAKLWLLNQINLHEKYLGKAKKVVDN